MYVISCLKLCKGLNTNVYLPCFHLFQPSATQTPGVCRNIITGLHIEFIYANVGSLANPQAKIIGASYQYQVQDEIRYQVSVTRLNMNKSSLKAIYFVLKLSRFAL